jgi:tetratricopeptide (TPR) repeat protein
LERTPADYRALLHQGVLLNRLGKVDEAIFSYRAASRAGESPEEKAKAFSNLAFTLRKRVQPPRLEEALQAAEDGLLESNISTRCWREKAEALQALGRREESLLAWERLLELPEVLASDFNAAGYGAARLEQDEKARAIFADAAKRFPDDSSVPQMEGWALINLGAPADAVAAFRRSEKLLKEGVKPSADVLAGLALAQKLTGEEAGAIATFKQLIESDEKLNWAEPKTIAGNGWPDAERLPLEALRQATLKRHPDAAKKTKE